MITANSSASTFFAEIQNNNNNNNKGSCTIDFPFSPSLPSCNLFDMAPPPQPDQNDASFVGYMDSLCSDDFNTSWFSNFNFENDMSEPLPATTQNGVQVPPLPVMSPATMSEVLNNQASHVSDSSLNTSLSSDAGVVANKPVVVVSGNEDGLEFAKGNQADAQDRDHDEEQRIKVMENQNDQNQTKKSVKLRKKDKKKQRPPKVVFKTETKVDHLDDGYRWRKYGQKPLKNSPFPRSYYRCTTPGCDVKKRIERFAPEPSMLLTSYEGNHTHRPPMAMHDACLEIMQDAISVGVRKIHHNLIKTNGVGVAGNQFVMSHSQPQEFQNHNQNVILNKPELPPLSYNNGYSNSFNIAPTMNVVNSANNFPPLNVFNSADHNFHPLNVVNSSAPHNSPPMNVVNSSAAQNSPPLNVANSASAAHNSPPSNVVNSADNFMNPSTLFSEFLQNLGGCNFSMLTDNLMSNDGLLQEMIMPRETRGAWAGAGAER